MIQPALHRACVNPGTLQQIQHLRRQRCAANVRVFDFIVLRREAVVAGQPPTVSFSKKKQKLSVTGGAGLLVDQGPVLVHVHLNVVLAGLPVRREYDNGFGLDCLRDLTADLREVLMGGVRRLEHDVRTAVGDEVNGGTGGHCVFVRGNSWRGGGGDAIDEKREEDGDKVYEVVHQRGRGRMDGWVCRVRGRTRWCIL